MRLTIIALIILVSSCTVTKKLHSPGYHVEWNHHYTATDNVPENKSIREVNTVSSSDQNDEAIISDATEEMNETKTYDENDLTSEQALPERDRETFVAKEKIQKINSKNPVFSFAKANVQRVVNSMKGTDQKVGKDAPVKYGKEDWARSAFIFALLGLGCIILGLSVMFSDFLFIPTILITLALSGAVIFPILAFIFALVARKRQANGETTNTTRFFILFSLVIGSLELGILALFLLFAIFMAIVGF